MVVTSKEILMDLGLTSYESMAYLALLSASPLTAYETAKRSGIPNPKIYDVMSRLLDRGMIELVQEDKKLYVPLEPSDYIRTERTKVNGQLDQLEKVLEKERTPPEHSYVWNLQSMESMMEQAKALINCAEREVLLSLWPEEYDPLQRVLRDAAKRDVSIAMVQFGQQPAELGQCFRHPISDTLFEEKGGRSFAFCADSSVALMGIIRGEAEVEASWSRSFGFASLAEDYIRHDIYIMKIVKRFDRQLVQRFGSHYHLLRDVFHDQEVENGDGIY